MVAGGRKSIEETVTVDRVGGEQAAEEHDFGDQEQTHAQGDGLVLLLEVVEVVR